MIAWLLLFALCYVVVLYNLKSSIIYTYKAIAQKKIYYVFIFVAMFVYVSNHYFSIKFNALANMETKYLLLYIHQFT